MPFILQRRRILASGSPVWTPMQLSTPPTIWGSAKQLNGATGSIDTIPDLSGNGNSWTSSGTARGTYNATGNNGQPSIDLDGVDDGYASPSIASASSWTFWFVGRVIAFTSTANVFAVDDYAPDGTYILGQLNAANMLAINASMGVISAVSAGTGTLRGYCFEGSAAGASLTANDGTSNSNVSNFSKSAAVMRIGRRGDGLYANYGFGEVVFVPSLLTTGEKALMWNYINRQWGITTP